MKYGSLIFGKEDFVMIKRFQEMNCTLEDYAHQNTLDILESNMSKAMILDSNEVPDDIIQLYSKVTVTCESKWQETFRIVAPFEVNIKLKRISVVSSLGASVIGLSEGDKIRYGLPGNMMSLVIKKVKLNKRKVTFDIAEDVIKKILPKNYRNSLTLNI